MATEQIKNVQLYGDCVERFAPVREGRLHQRGEVRFLLKIQITPFLRS